MYYRKDTVLICDALTQRILYSWNNVCGGRGRFINRGRQKTRWMKGIIVLVSFSYRREIK